MLLVRPQVTRGSTRRGGSTVRPGFAAVLREDHVRSVVVWSVIVRLPSGVATLLLVLFLVQQGYSGGEAGIVIAARTIAMAVTSPTSGRLLDRGFARPILITTGVLHLVGLSALLLSGVAHADAGLLIAFAAVWGVGSPPTNGVTRPLWPRLVRAELVPVGYSLEVLIVDILYVGGPIVATIVAALLGPGQGLLLAGVGVAVGSAGLATSAALRLHGPRRATQASSSRDRATEALLRRPSVWAVLAIGACLLCFSIWTEVTIPLQMEAAGTPGWSGALIAVWSVGSIVGVLLFVRLQPSWRLRTQLLVFVAIYLVAATALFLAGAGLGVYGAVLFAVGVLVSPCTNLWVQLSNEVAPRSRQAEMFTLTGTASQIGGAAGGFLAGVAGDDLPPFAAVGAASLPIAVALLIALVFRLVPGRPGRRPGVV